MLRRLQCETWSVCYSILKTSVIFRLTWRSGHASTRCGCWLWLATHAIGINCMSILLSPLQCLPDLTLYSVLFASCTWLPCAMICPWLSDCVAVQANKTLLSTTVASQVDAARTGIQALENAQRHLATMQECYRVSEPICLHDLE